MSWTSNQDWSNRWPNFAPEEIYSPHCLQFYRHKLNPESLDKLQLFREMLGYKLMINHADLTHRGVRTVKENKDVGGAAESMHVAGRAFDVSCYEISMDDLLKAILEARLFGGIGIYKTFIHCDDRFCDPQHPTIWDLRK